MLPTVLDSGSGISIAGEAGVRRLRQHFLGLQVVYSYEGQRQLRIIITVDRRGRPLRHDCTG